MVGAGLTAGLTPVGLKEIVYQAVPYVGMARALEFLHAANDVLTERGVPLPLPGQSTTTPATRLERGLAVQKQIVGGERVDAMYDAAPGDGQHLQRYLSGNCFGDYLTRSGIGVPARELRTFAMLASLGGCDAQVKGHVAANLNVGNDRARLLSVLTVLIRRNRVTPGRALLHVRRPSAVLAVAAGPFGAPTRPARLPVASGEASPGRDNS